MRQQPFKLKISNKTLQTGARTIESKPELNAKQPSSILLIDAAAILTPIRIERPALASTASTASLQPNANTSAAKRAWF